MEKLLDQFKALSDDEKVAFMKETMHIMAEIFGRDPAKMTGEMMPSCMNVMRSRGFDMEKMRTMMKTRMG